MTRPKGGRGDVGAGMQGRTGEGVERDLPISTRRVISGGGRVVRHLTVHCALRDERVDVRACEGCARCVSVEPPAPGRGGRVRCVQPSKGEPDAPRPALHARVREVMAREVVCVTEDVDVGTVAAVLLREQPGGVPVVDDGGALLGLLTETDLLAEWEHPRSDRRTAGDVDCSRALVIHADAEVTRAAAVMAQERVSALAVVGDNGALEGQICLGDVARWVARMDGFILPPGESPPRGEGPQPRGDAT